MRNPYSITPLAIECDACNTYVGYGAWIESKNNDASYGIRVRASSTTSGSYAVRAYATSSSATSNYGVRADASSGSTTNRAFHGYASGEDSWAGYFSGNVYSSSGTWDGSDERFKKEIMGLDTADMLERLRQIQPRRYRFLTEEELEQAGMPMFSSKEGEHFGVIAQELEETFPKMVIDKLSVLNEGSEMEEDPNEIETVMTKAVNYTGLIPVLIAGMQEQQNQIEELEARITALENMMQE